MTTQKNKPIDTIRDGSLKATIWKHTGKNGDFYVTELPRTYKDEQGVYHDRHSYSGTELLRLARLAKKAYDRECELRQLAYSKSD